MYLIIIINYSVVIIYTSFQLNQFVHSSKTTAEAKPGSDPGVRTEGIKICLNYNITLLILTPCL